MAVWWYRLVSDVRRCDPMVTLNAIEFAVSLSVLIMGIYISISPLKCMMEPWVQWCICLYATALLLTSIIGCSVTSQTGATWHGVYALLSGLLLLVSFALITVLLLDLLSLQKTAGSIYSFYKRDWEAAGCTGGDCTVAGCPTPLTFNDISCDSWDVKSALMQFMSDPPDSIILGCAGEDLSGLRLAWCRSEENIASELEAFIKITLSFILAAALLQLFCIFLNHIYRLRLESNELDDAVTSDRMCHGSASRPF
ncbi:hypothetical protein FOL47_009445 [Perkinsus chesapeaki]|uniref:Uncharacterized protein n=1 Tax=Perkinsus chesapeaki TaxID=330153 RepID=A0A7J6MS07_PERCH|nr:hypothetical protein FOL47_009445 [Perkinsus chesapeaki]